MATGHTIVLSKKLNTYRIMAMCDGIYFRHAERLIAKATMPQGKLGVKWFKFDESGVFGSRISRWRRQFLKVWANFLTCIENMQANAFLILI
jgi:hypothetical protein